MDPHDAALGHALRARRAHVVLVDLVQDEGPIEPQARCDADHQSDQDRQQRIVEQVLAERIAPPLHWKPAELVGEEILEHDDVDQNRNRQADGADDHHHPVGQRPAHIRDGKCQRDGDQRIEHQQRHDHRQRRTQSRRENIGDTLVRAPARAEIRGDDLLDENPELDVVRLIDADLPADVVDLFLARDLPGEHVRRIAADGVEQNEHEQHDAEHRRDHLPDSSNDVGGHRSLARGQTPISDRTTLLDEGAKIGV